MGCGSACSLFEKVASAINWIFREKFGYANSFHYLDDFCIIEENYRETKLSLETFQILCKKLGIPLSQDKTVGPSQSVTYLGIYIDTVKMEASIPTDKITTYIGDIKRILEGKICTQGDLKSIIGKLNWVTSIILPGRSFLRRLHDAVRGQHMPNKTISLTTEIKKDLLAWLEFLLQFNGKAIISYFPSTNSRELNFYSDASFLGAGATFRNKWIQIVFPKHWSDRGIVYLELFPIVVMAHICQNQLKDTRVIFHTDNWAVMNILNKASSKLPIIMTLVRPLMTLALKNNVLITSKHIFGHLNLIPDRISRFQITQEELTSLGMDVLPTPIPNKWKLLNWQKLEMNY